MKIETGTEDQATSSRSEVCRLHQFARRTGSSFDALIDQLGPDQMPVVRTHVAARNFPGGYRFDNGAFFDREIPFPVTPKGNSLNSYPKRFGCGCQAPEVINEFGDFVHDHNSTFVEIKNQQSYLRKFQLLFRVC